MPDDMDRFLRGIQKQVQGEYPDGRLNDQDEGASVVAIGVENDCVVLRFPHAVTWIGLPKDYALAMAAGIIANANKLP